MSREIEEPPPAEPQALQNAPRRELWLDFSIALAILLTTFASYSSVVRFGFISIDDPGYVYSNPVLRTGLNAHTLHWIFLSFSPDNWFPVTRLSLYLDYHLFGARAGWYHGENILLHVFASLILYFFLRKTTRKTWPCALVALIFALHPLHVESVAWIAERKDVLCAVFWFATLWAWQHYTERGGAGRYGLALTLFALGLMAKPMMVSLPIVLFVLDLWPLQRVHAGSRPSAIRITEKIPFFVFSAAAALATIIAQKQAHTIQTLDAYPVALRVENALVSLAAYIAETLWPARLWMMRAYPLSVPAWQAAGAALGIVAVSFFVLRQTGRRPWLATGWFWFLITLFPVIGLLQVGPQAQADRYMYIPMVGLTLMLAFSVDALVAQWPRLRAWAAVAGFVVCIAMAGTTWRQTQFWKNSDALLLHAIDMDHEDYLAYTYLATKLRQQQPDQILDAISYNRTALQIRPEMASLHAQLADSLCRAEQWDTCIEEFRVSIRIEHKTALLHWGLGRALLQAGRTVEAIQEDQRALQLDPQMVEAMNDLGIILRSTSGREREALQFAQRAAELQPEDPALQSNLASILAVQGRLQEAVQHYRHALIDDPDFVTAHVQLSNVLGKLPEMEVEANDELRAALNAQKRVDQRNAESPETP